MAGLCEGGNELSGSLKAVTSAVMRAAGRQGVSSKALVHTCGVTVSASGRETRWPGFEFRSGQVTWLRFFPGFSLNPIRANAGGLTGVPGENPCVALTTALLRHYGIAQHKL
ncbi:hypothetical protein ANN_21263 [Periplaneta americana]|uniref:Uncharacterized protein n=1 Tax=Periplaneta americana TaxID=6978 RepID=A0ABQ8SEY9_PERAM|nr:hypothetical protein ANN_21263 [Periplaneta americana]